MPTKRRTSQTPQNSNTKRLMTIEEVAEYLSISPRTIYNSIGPKSKKAFPIRARRIGRLVRFDRRDVDRFIERL